MERIGSVKTPYGQGVLESTFYPSNGALALVINSDFERIATVSVNLDHGQPCTQSGDLPPGHFYVDANNLTDAFRKSLLESGLVEATNLPEGVSGYCSYPVWRLAPREAATA